MDALEEFLAGPKAAPKAAPSSTPAQQQGVEDLRTFIDQAQRRLKDTVPGSETYQRLNRELGDAQKALSGYGGTPAPSAAPAADPLEAFLSGKAAPTAAPAVAQIPGAPPVAAPSAEQPPLTGVAGVLQNIFGPAAKIWQERGPYLKGAGEAAIKLLEQGIAMPVSAAGAVLTSRGMTPQQMQERQQQIQQAMSGYQVGPEGQQILEKLGAAADIAKLPPIIPEAGTMAAAAQVKPTAVPRAKATMAEWKAQLTPAEAQAQFAAKQGKAGSIGAQMVESNPYAGQITGEETVRGTFPQVKLSKTPENVPVTEQATRAQIANEVLGDSGRVRPGVVTGNEDILRNEYALAKRPETGPAGELLKKQIADEQVALSNYAEQRIKNTGASQTLTSPYERGERINSFYAGPSVEGETPRSVPAFFKEQKQRVYDEARTRIGNNPIKSTNIDAVLEDPQFKAGLKLTGTEGVAAGAQDLINLAKTTGFKDAQGNVFQPNTINAWDAVKKFNNSKWTPQNAKVIREINRAIDRDIASAGGGDLLKKADSLHEAEKTLFGSKGIKDIFGEIDSNGVETGKVSFEALPQKLNSMPINQWKHVYDVADKFSRGELHGPLDKATGQPKWVLQIPEDLRIEAQSAKAEMLGNIAREVHQAGAAKAGVWNQNATNKMLNARADKIKYAFPLDEQQAFHKLNYAGYLMPGEHAYEGGGMQIRRLGLIEQGLEKAGAATGAAVGGYFGGPAGIAAGGYLGQKAGARGAEKLATRAAKKEAQKVEEEMKKTSKLSEMLPK